MITCILKRLKECDSDDDAVDYVRLLQLFNKSTYYGGKPELSSLIVQACFLDDLKNGYW